MQSATLPTLLAPTHTLVTSRRGASLRSCSPSTLFAPPRHLTPFYEPLHCVCCFAAAASIGVILSGVVYFLHSSRSTIDVCRLMDAVLLQPELLRFVVSLVAVARPPFTVESGPRRPRRISRQPRIQPGPNSRRHVREFAQPMAQLRSSTDSHSPARAQLSLLLGWRAPTSLRTACCLGPLCSCPYCRQRCCTAHPRHPAFARYYGKINSSACLASDTTCQQRSDLLASNSENPCGIAAVKRYCSVKRI